MSTMHKNGLSMPSAEMTIPEAEELIEETLENLAGLGNEALQGALRFLAPEGYQVVVELCSDNGRSKRRSASVSSWNPEEDEIRIYFERANDEEDHGVPVDPWNRANTPIRMRNAGRGAHSATARAWTPEPLAMLPEEMDAAVEELRAALAEAERGGHAFIALKWFRDAFLPRKMYAWTRHPEQRQMILAESIQRGCVVTGKIPNPKSPAFPTTTIQLHREGEANVFDKPEDGAKAAIAEEDREEV